MLPCWMLEKVRHWGWALRFPKPLPFPVSYLCPLLVDEDVTSPLFLPPHLHVTIMDSGSISQNKYIYLGHRVFVTGIGTNNNQK